MTDPCADIKTSATNKKEQTISHPIDKFDCFVNMLRDEYGFDARILSESELHDPLLPNHKGFVVKTPFKGYSIQIITDFMNSLKIIYRRDDAELDYIFEWATVWCPYEQKIFGKLFRKYFECNDQTDMTSICCYANLIIPNICRGFTIDYFSNLLQFYASKLGVSKNASEEPIYEYISKKYAHILGTDNPNSNHYLMYGQGFVALQNAIANEVSAVLVRNKSLINSLQMIVLSFLIFS